MFWMASRPRTPSVWATPWPQASTTAFKGWGLGLKDSNAALTRIGYNKWRKGSVLPSGHFVGGAGDFATGARYMGIGDAEAAGALAIVDSLETGIEKGLITGLSDTARETVTKHLKYINDANAETIMEGVDFLVTFNDTLGRVNDAAADQARALEDQAKQIKAAAEQRASAENEYVKKFLDQSKQFFGGNRQDNLSKYTPEGYEFARLGKPADSIDQFFGFHDVLGKGDKQFKRVLGRIEDNAAGGPARRSPMLGPWPAPMAAMAGSRSSARCSSLREIGG